MPFQRSEAGPPALKDLPKPGYYVWTVGKIEDGPRTENGDTIRWYLSPVDPRQPDRFVMVNGFPAEIRMLTSNKVGPSSRSGQYLQAIFGCPIELVDLDDAMEQAVGGEFGAVMSINEKGWPQIGEPVETDPKPAPVKARP